MHILKQLLILVGTVCIFNACSAQPSAGKYVLHGEGDRQSAIILPGAYSFEAYLPLLKGKRVAIIGNQTSEVNNTLLPDTLLALGVQVVKLFSPEHGFRGSADAGATIKNDTDAKTGLPIVSLYGSSKKLKAGHLKDVDVVIYDLQDVGARFFTYISTLEYTMEACAEHKKMLMILDRPNPLGHIVDGPILKKEHRSFVGMQSVPVIYGMTPGEYAQMIKGEKWVNASSLDLVVIPVKNYNHTTSRYQLPVSPSPNLKNMAAIYLYPSLCLFEGTVISLGRGTAMPFQQYGHPDLKGMSYSFTPQSIAGASQPPLLGRKCFGELVAETPAAAEAAAKDHLSLHWILKAYQLFPDKKNFFNNFFPKLAGTITLREQIEQGKTEDEIRRSWQPELEAFRKIRKKYLLYNE